MTRRGLKRWRPGGLDPAEHNRLVRRRKTYRRLAAEFRTAGRSSDVAAASFRRLAVSADRAAESLRIFRIGLAVKSGATVMRFTGADDRVGRIIR